MFTEIVPQPPLNLTSDPDTDRRIDLWCAIEDQRERLRTLRAEVRRARKHLAMQTRELIRLELAKQRRELASLERGK